ncbi:MAG: hypothetical protein HY777_03650 [Betaproteobacteria bacterium]|nr:hypothetical protein [Betaproteobacteria bacterium]
MAKETPAGGSTEFIKNLWGNMGFSLPGMVAPTFDVEELEKRIKDLKSVEGWLKMNLSMLQMTIQSLEMQSSTLVAVKAMGAVASARSAGEAAVGGAPQAALWPWSLMQQVREQTQQNPAGPPATGHDPVPAPAPAGPPEPRAKRPKKAA